MRKILSVGMLLLGSLGSMQAQAQATVSAPILEALQINKTTADKIVAIEQEIRDLKILATELEQLRIAAQNAKRASPKLWDSSLNSFENLSKTVDQSDSIANAVQDFRGALKRSGCTDGALDAASLSPQAKGQTQRPDDIAIASDDPQQVAAAYERKNLRARCRYLAVQMGVQQRVAEEAAMAKDQTESQAKEKGGGDAYIMDNVLNELKKTRAQILENTKNDALFEEEKQLAQLAEAAQQKAMHERLMKAPSSRKKAKDPALTVDPRNY